MSLLFYGLREGIFNPPFALVSDPCQLFLKEVSGLSFRAIQGIAILSRYPQTCSAGGCRGFTFAVLIVELSPLKCKDEAVDSG